MLLGGDFELKKLFDFTVLLFMLNDFFLVKFDTVFPEIPILLIGSTVGFEIKSMTPSLTLIAFSFFS